MRHSAVQLSARFALNTMGAALFGCVATSISLAGMMEGNSALFWLVPVTLMFLVAVIGPSSGCGINPAVSLAQFMDHAVTKDFARVHPSTSGLAIVCGIDTLASIAGGICGGYAALYFSVDDDSLVLVAAHILESPVMGYGLSVSSEVLGTALLCTVNLAFLHHYIQSSLSPALHGAAIFIGGLATFGYSGGFFNPTLLVAALTHFVTAERAIARRSETGTSSISYRKLALNCTLVFVAQLIGAFIAVSISVLMNLSAGGESLELSDEKNLSSTTTQSQLESATSSPAVRVRLRSDDSSEEGPEQAEDCVQK